MGNGSSRADEGESVEDLMQHLEAAKELDGSRTDRARRNRTGSALQDKMRRSADAAVLAGNHEPRLERS